jgi:hypothetical protein
LGPVTPVQSNGGDARIGNYRFRCELCPASKKPLSANYKSRGNLRKHISSQHSHALQKFDDWCKANDNRKRPCSNDDDGTENECKSATKQKQQTLSQIFMQGRRITQTELDKWIVQYIADGILPFHHVDTDAFKVFVSRLVGQASMNQVKIKCGKTYRNQMKLLYDAKKNDLTFGALGGAQKVCLTIDRWSCRQKGYVGITGQWFEKCGSDIQRQHPCMALQRTEGRCTYMYLVLVSIIEIIIAEYNLKNKISHYITVSGSNFVKAFSIFGEKFTEVSPETEQTDETKEAIQMEEISITLSDSCCVQKRPTSNSIT